MVLDNPTDDLCDDAIAFAVEPVNSSVVRLGSSAKPLRKAKRLGQSLPKLQTRKPHRANHTSRRCRMVVRQPIPARRGKQKKAQVRVAARANPGSARTARIVGRDIHHREC
jgi:hypothetical protein